MSHPAIAEIIAERDQLRAAEREARTMAEEIFGDYQKRLGEVLAERDRALAELASEREKNTYRHCTCDDHIDSPCPVHKREVDLQNERDAARAEAAQWKEKAEYWRSKVVWCFSEEEVPQYIQGKQGEHEICGEVTADEVNGLVKSLIDSRARVAVLEAALREALPIIRAYRASVATKGEAYEDKDSRAHYCEIHIETALKGAQT